MTDSIRRLAIITLTTSIGAVWLYVRGPLPVIRFTTELAEPVPYWYSLSAFPVLGMLLADLVGLVSSRAGLIRVIELAAQIGFLVAAGHLRLVARVPISGHLLLFSYFLFRRILLGSDGSLVQRIELTAALALAGVAAFVKLFVWTDPLTFLFAVAAGALLAGVSWWAAQKAHRVTPPSEP